MESRRPLTGPERELWGALLVVMHTVPRALESRLREEARISFTEYQALSCLRDAQPDGLRINELAECLGLSTSRATRIGEKLVARGDAARQSRSGGGRRHPLLINHVGLDRFDEATRAYLAAARCHVLDRLAARGLDVRRLASILAGVAAKL